MKRKKASFDIRSHNKKVQSKEPSLEAEKYIVTKVNFIGGDVSCLAEVSLRHKKVVQNNVIAAFQDIPKPYLEVYAYAENTFRAPPVVNRTLCKNEFVIIEVVKQIRNRQTDVVFNTIVVAWSSAWSDGSTQTFRRVKSNFPANVTVYNEGTQNEEQRVIYYFEEEPEYQFKTYQIKCVFQVNRLMKYRQILARSSLYKESDVKDSWLKCIHDEMTVEDFEKCPLSIANIKAPHCMISNKKLAALLYDLPGPKDYMVDVVLLDLFRLTGSSRHQRIDIIARSSELFKTNGISLNRALQLDGEWYASQEIWKFEMKVADLLKTYQKRKNYRSPESMVRKCSISVITGSAGTGKTTTQANIAINQPSGIYVLCCAPTTRAAKKLYDECVLRGAKNIGWSSIQRLVVAGTINSGASGSSSVLCLIDESSMLDIFQLEKILLLHGKKLTYFKKEVNEQGDTYTEPYFISLEKIVFTGDVKQLPSIAPGCVLQDLVKILPSFELTTIHRQNESSAIVRNAHRVHSKPDQPFEEVQGVFETAHVSNIPLYVKQNVTKDTMVIVQTNELVKSLNLMLQEMFNPDGEIILSKNVGNKYTPSEYMYRVGDPVFTIKNHWEHSKTGIVQQHESDDESTNGCARTTIAGKTHISQPNVPSNDESTDVLGSIMNGETFKIGNVNGNGYVEIYSTVEDKSVSIHLDKLEDYICPAFVSNLHKAQGYEAPSVMFIMNSHKASSRQSLYTAITRAKSQFQLAYSYDWCMYNARSKSSVRVSNLVSMCT